MTKTFLTAMISDPREMISVNPAFSLLANELDHQIPVGMYGCLGFTILMYLIVVGILLKIACWLYSRFAGPVAAVPPLQLLPAMKVILFTGVLQAILTAILSQVLGKATAITLPKFPESMQILGVVLVPNAISLIVGVFLEAWLLQILLRTSYARGLKIAVLHVVVIVFFFSVTFAALITGLSQLG